MAWPGRRRRRSPHSFVCLHRLTSLCYRINCIWEVMWSTKSEPPCQSNQASVSCCPNQLLGGISFSCKSIRPQDVSLLISWNAMQVIIQFIVLEIEMSNPKRWYSFCDTPSLVVQHHRCIFQEKNLHMLCLSIVCMCNEGNQSESTLDY